MKGVSSVIAIILILMIVVALAALAYTWFTGIFASLTSTTSTAVTTSTGQMATAFTLESPTNRTTTQIRFVVRNTGTSGFNCSDTKISAYLDGVAPTSGPTRSSGACTAAPYTLNPGETVVYQATYTANPALSSCTQGCPGVCSNILKIVIETGLSDSENVRCVLTAS